MQARPAVYPFGDQMAKVFDRIAVQLAPLLPLAECVADHFAGVAVLAGGDGTIDGRRQLRRQGTAALLDRGHV